MSYMEKVQEKIKNSTEGTNERMELWQKINEAYEKGGMEQVKSTMAEMANKVKGDFKEVIGRLQKML